MLRNVFLKTLRDGRRGLVGWTIALVLIVLLETALWPAMPDMAEMEKLLASYPEVMRELFNLDDFATGTGFLNAELYSALLPILFLVHGIGHGGRAIAGEEAAGTLEVLLTRVSPVRLPPERAAALAVQVAALGLALFVAVVACSAIFGLGVTVAAAATGSLAMVLLGVEFGWLALAIGAATGRRALAVSAAAAAAVAGYVLYVAGALVPAVEPWQPVSPFHQAIEGGPLGAGLPPAYGWMLLAGAVVLLAALPTFDRRDIHAHL